MRRPRRGPLVAFTSAIAVAASGAAVAGPSAAGAGTGVAEAPRWSQLQPSALARQEVVAGRIGGAVYVAGGFAGFEPTTVVERYDIALGSWTTVAPLPLPLNHSAAAVHADRLYVADGFIGDPAGLLRSTGPATALLLRYDPATDTWTELEAPPVKRAAAAAGVIGDRLYLAGGVSPESGELGLLEVYDFGTGRWTRGPDMALPREHVSAAVADGKLYVIGGRLDPAAATGAVTTVERFDPARDRWERVPDLNHARSAAGAVTVGDSIVVFGGEDATGIVTSAERFDPASGRWSPLPDMLMPRAALGAASYGSRALAIEGTPTPRFGSSDTVEALTLPRPGLRLTLSPRRVRTGMRVRYRARVTAASAGGTVAVAGARVRLGGRRARTDARGRATFILRLGRVGRHPANATRAGFAPARASLRVVHGRPNR